MFRFQTPLIALVLLIGWGVDVEQAALAQGIDVPTPSQSPKRQSRTMSLEEAIAIAEENNEELRIARLQVANAEEGLKVARAGKYPTVTASGQIFRTDSSNFDVNPGGVVQTAQQGVIQQQTAINAAQQRQATRDEFQEQLARLAVQLQDTGLAQEDNVDQQLTELGTRSNLSASLPNTVAPTPFRPFPGFSPSNSSNFSNSIENSIEGLVNLNYTILTGGARSAGIRRAKKLLKLSEIGVTLQSRDLQLDVTNSYYDLQEIRALMQVALSAVSSAEQTLKNTILTEEAGLSTKFEILQAEVQLANAQQNLRLADSLQLTAQRQLAETLSLDENVNIVPTDTVNPAGDWSTSLPKSIVVAQNNRLELEQTLLNRDVEKEDRTIAKAPKRPNLSSFAQLSASASDTETGTDFTRNENNLQGRVGYGVGLQVTLNAFDGGEIKAQVKEIDETIKSLETQYDSQKNSIRVAVESGYFSLEQNRKNIKTSLDSQALAQESLELARLRLKAGLGTQLDVIQADSDLTQAKGNVISAILDYNRALASLERNTAYEIPLEDYSGERPPESN